MASLIERRRRSGVAWQVRWRQDGTSHSDTFGTKRQALRFQFDVEDARRNANRSAKDPASIRRSGSVGNPAASVTRGAPATVSS